LSHRLTTSGSICRSEEPAARPKQYLLHVRYCEGRPYRNDGLPDHALKAIYNNKQKDTFYVLAQPNILLLENKKGHVVSGGEIDAGVKMVEYGTIIDVLARSNKDRTTELDFVAEWSSAGAPRTSDVGDHATRVSAEKVCGKARMRPGIVYRVAGTKREHDETWWEFQIDQLV
jgi:hypothetical protein